VIEERDGTPGDLAGTSVLDGELVSEAVDCRTDLILPRGSGAGADVAAISDSLSATASDGATREVDGRNREPGPIRGCGGDGGDQPTERPKHNFTCTDGSELIHSPLASALRPSPAKERRPFATPPVGWSLSAKAAAAPYRPAAPSSPARVKGPTGCLLTRSQMLRLA